MKKFLGIILAIAFTFVTVSAALAFDKGNERKGKYTYKKVYKACNERGGIDTTQPPLNPDAKTQAQWERMFDGGDFAAFKCEEEWRALSKDDMADIFAYLHDHAADSPSPAKCK